MLQTLKKVLDKLTGKVWFYSDPVRPIELGSFILTHPTGDFKKQRVGRMKSEQGNQYVLELGHFRGIEWIPSTKTINIHKNLVVAISEKEAVLHLERIQRQK